MPDSPKTRLRHPNRATQPHSGRSLDPVATRKHRGPGARPLILVGGGLIGFSYAFNLGGLQVFLDPLFAGANASVRSHNDDVVGFVPKALPYVGFAIAGVAALVVVVMIGRAAESVSIPRKPKLPAPVAKPKESAAPRPEQEFIKPARLAIREQDMRPKSVQRSSDLPSRD